MTGIITGLLIKYREGGAFPSRNTIKVMERDYFSSSVRLLRSFMILPAFHSDRRNG
jgi:hypothetical protein